LPTISRAFLELGASTEGLQKGLQEAITIAETNGAKLSSAGKAMVLNFENALNPTKQLATQIEALEKAGKSAGDIQAVLGDKIKYAADQATKNGQAIDPLVAKHAQAIASTGAWSFSVENLGKTLTDLATNPLQTVQTGIGSFLAKLGPVAVGLGGIATAGAAAAVGITKIAMAAADDVEHMKNLSAQTGLSVQQLDALRQIAAEAGLESLDLGRTIGMLNNQLGEGKGEFVDSLKALNIQLTDTATGKPKDAVALLDEIRIKLLSIQDPAERAQVSQAVLGGRLRELIPLLVNSESGIGDMTTALIAQGAVISNESIAKLDALDKKVDAVSRIMKIAKTSINEAAGETLSFASSIAKSHPWLDAMAMAIFQMLPGGKASVKAYSAVVHEAAAETKKQGDETKTADLTLKAFQKSLEDVKAHEKATKATKEHKEKVKELTSAYDEYMAKQIDFTPIINQQINSHVQLAGVISDQTAELAKLKPIYTDLNDIIIPVNSSVWDQTKKMGEAKIATNQLGNAVSTTLTNMTQSIATEATKWAGPFQDFASAALSSVMEGFFKPFTDELTNLGTKLGGWLSGLGGNLGLGGIFGSAGTSAAGSAGGAAGSAGGGVGSVIGAGSGILSGLIGAAGGIVGGLISGFMGPSKGDLSEVEVNTRYTQLGIVGPNGMIDQLWEVIRIQWLQVERLEWVDNSIRGLGKGLDIPGYAEGTNYVSKTGLAMLHQGEQVIPSGGNGGVTININGPVYGLDDLDRKISASIKRTYQLGGLSYLKA
jgi:hypothetical protein